MGVHRALCSGSEAQRTTENPRHPRDPQRYLLLRLEEWMSLAAFTPRLSAVVHRLPLLQTMESRWHLGKGEPDHPRVAARYARAKSPTQCRDSGLAIRKDYRGGRRSARMRRW